jgi:hypothetical protein
LPHIAAITALVGIFSANPIALVKELAYLLG